MAKFSAEAASIAAIMSIGAAKAYTNNNEATSATYTTDEGVLTLKLVYAEADAWRWDLDGKPVRVDRALKLITDRLQRVTSVREG